MRIITELPACIEDVTAQRVSEAFRGVISGLSLLQNDTQQHVELVGIHVEGYEHKITVTVKVTREARFQTSHESRCKSIVFEVLGHISSVYDSTKRHTYSKVSEVSIELDSVA